MNNKLGEFVNKIRTEKGLSLREFGNLCGLSHSHIDSIEKGYDYRTGKAVRVTNETLEKLSAILNVSEATLLNMSLNKDAETEPQNDKKATQELTLDDFEYALFGEVRELDEEEKEELLRDAKRFNELRKFRNAQREKDMK